MNDRKLRIFVEVAAHLSMSAVANKLYLSQPAISQVIHDLEEELGTKLFDRIGRKLYLTEAGKAFLPYARKTLNTYDEGLKAVGEVAGSESGRLSLGASTTVGIYLLPEIIGRFLESHPRVDVALAIENTRFIEEKVLYNVLDFAFVEGPVDSAEIIADEFCGDELVFITHPKHAWAASGLVDLEGLSREKFILREPGSGTRDVFERAMRQLKADYRVAFELGNTEAIKKAVEAGMGVSCISGRCVTREVELGKLATAKLSQMDIKRSFNLIYHRDKYMSALFRTFIGFARDRCANAPDSAL